MFRVQETKAGAPGRFMRDPPFKPDSVNAVSGPVAIALEDAIETEKYFAGYPPPPDFLCKLPRSRRFEAEQISVWPFSLGPVFCRIERRPMTALDDSASQPLEIAFRSSGRGVSASHKTYIHRSLKISRALLAREIFRLGEAN
jgi:hypothetical protein